MKKTVSILILFSISLLSIAQSPNWTVNPAAFQFTATLTGRLIINDTVINSTANKLGAFVNEEVRGVANATTLNGQQVYFMTLYSDLSSGENVTFKAYIADQDSIHSSIDSVVFASSAIFGDPANPYNLRLNACQFLASEQTFVECAGFSVTVGTNTYDTSGTYTDVLSSANGCDSVVTTHLTITPPQTTTQTFTECAPFSVTVGANTYDTTGIFYDTLVSSIGCDSIVITNLTINQPGASAQTFSGCNGLAITVGTHTYNTTGVYTDVFVGANGCDSTVTTTLTIATGGTQTFTECEGFFVTVGANIYNTTGVYTDTFTSVNGCDSIIITNLTIVQPASSSQTIVACPGSSITVGANTYDTTGAYTDVFTSANGCDSTVYTNLIISATGNQSFTECEGFSVTVGANTYTTTGVYTNIITGGNGCTLTTDLTIIQPATHTQTLTVCAGSSVTVGANTYSSTGIYTDVFTGTNGCDSIVTTNLTIADTVETSTSLNVATITATLSNASYQWIDCNNGNAAIAGETNQSFSPIANGDYAVIVSLSSCSDTSDCVQVTNVGLEPVSTASAYPFSVFPNPASRYVTVNISDTEESGYVKVINMDGRVLKAQKFNRQKTVTLDMENIATGLYQIKIETDNNKEQSAPGRTAIIHRTRE